MFKIYRQISKRPPPWFWQISQFSPQIFFYNIRITSVTHPRKIPSSHILMAFLPILVFRPPHPPRITSPFFFEKRSSITRVASFLAKQHCGGARGWTEVIRICEKKNCEENREICQNRKGGILLICRSKSKEKIILMKLETTDTRDWGKNRMVSGSKNDPGGTKMKNPGI